MVRQHLEPLGYLVWGSELNAADFGVPQQRRRAWLVRVLRERVPGGLNTTRIRADLALFQRPCPSLESCLDLRKGMGTSSRPQGLKGRARKNKDSNPPKWIAGFQEQCDVYGKASQPVEIQDLYISWKKGHRWGVQNVSMKVVLIVFLLISDKFRFNAFFV